MIDNIPEIGSLEYYKSIIKSQQLADISQEDIDGLQMEDITVGESGEILDVSFTRYSPVIVYTIENAKKSIEMTLVKK